MRDATPEILREFVERTRTLWQEPLSDAARWERIGVLAHELLGSEELRERAQSWPVPDPDRLRAANLLFYEDPDYGFVVNGLIKGPKAGTPVHDHAHTWTVYGVLSGEERIVRYRRVDGGAADQAQLEKTDDYVVKPGFVDVVPPGIIHAEYAGEDRTVAVIIRSERVGSFPQNMFDPGTGKVTQAPGPEQLPYAL
jgi:predicted metal-dependent enzyme (double-stranded beta helix superfamily)